MARPSMTEHLAHRAVERTVAGRRAEYEREMARIVDSTFTVIERTGTLEPSMRVILAEANLSTQAFYRYFASKDELMLALLDEGRRRLLSSLQRRMLRSAGPEDQVRAWVEGVLAQAATGGAASRTRPWATSEERLAELFPEEQQASVDLLLGLLYEPIRHLRGASNGRARSSGDITDDALRQVAVMVYRLAFATLRSHLAAGTKPSPGETEDLVAFCIGGVTR
jgi:AcrR family transcriptional regulator